ncbi:MAG TPA: ABC transporter ATP-binding protein [Pedobacter sp.]|jgi:lipopolysaccharide transport system ATP-binding protein
MSNIAIKAENLSKAYQLGEIGTGTISRDLERWVARLRGKEDPFLRIGETNDRTSKGNSDIVWSLKDINFEIEQGDAVGIIGRNGAGKSTLLKILSKVTSPTTGKITGKGRIASLLEVGTGFHPELTGRENIFLNGAILGMRKAEIKKHFDAIVDFAGIERYIDTPVKRYSSGMYVRLAFAVAAHLESEILIVDEVLAVGDAEFQKKCLGKMGEVSKGEGRTVLFVSHNMSAVKSLCSKGLMLSNGQIALYSDVNQVTNSYFSSSKSESKDYYHKEGTRVVEIQKINLNSPERTYKIFQEIYLTIEVINKSDDLVDCEFFVLISNSEGIYSYSAFQEDNNQKFKVASGLSHVTFKTNNTLVPDKYFISAGIFDKSRKFIDWVEYAETFEVESLYSNQSIYKPRLGLTIPNCVWSYESE